MYIVINSKGIHTYMHIHIHMYTQQLPEQKQFQETRVCQPHTLGLKI